MSAGLYQLLCHHLSPHKRETFDRIAAQRTRHMALVLEDIYQTHNASAILRSAECWGIQDVHVIENTHSFHFHHRISKGAFDWLSVHRYTDHQDNTARCIAQLKSRGYRIVSTTVDPEAATPGSLDIERPFALVMGTELTGISDTMRQASDALVHIPTLGFTESLNVSVATAVLLHELSNRLRASCVRWQLSEAEQLELKIEWARKSIAWSDHLVGLYESGELKP